MHYALQRIASPIGVSTHELSEKVEESLPTIEVLEQKLKTAEIE